MIKEQGNELQEAQIIADFESCHFFSTKISPNIVFNVVVVCLYWYYFNDYIYYVWEANSL